MTDLAGTSNKPTIKKVTLHDHHWPRTISTCRGGFSPRWRGRSCAAADVSAHWAAKSPNPKWLREVSGSLDGCATSLVPSRSLSWAWVG